MCAFFESPKDVKLAVFESLPQFQSLAAGGWVSAREVTPSEDVARQLTALLDENARLRSSLEKAQQDLAKATTGVAAYEELYTLLQKKKVTVPRALFDPGEGNPEAEANVMRVILVYADQLARGVSNAMTAHESETFLFFNAASALAGVGLAEEAKVPARVSWQRLKLSKEGVRFVTWARIREARTESASASVEPSPEAKVAEVKRRVRRKK